MTAPVPGVSITDGAVIDGAAGNYNVKLSVDKAQIKTGGVNVTLTAANAPTMISVTVGGDTKKIDATTQFKTLLTAAQQKTGVFFKVTKSDGTTVKFLETMSTATLSDGDVVNTTDEYLKLTGDTVAVDVTGLTATTNSGTLSAAGVVKSTSYESSTAGSDYYVKNGADIVIDVTLKSSKDNDTLGAAAKATASNTIANSGTLTQSTPAAGAELFGTADDLGAAATGLTKSVTVQLNKTGISVNTGATLKIVLAE